MAEELNRDLRLQQETPSRIQRKTLPEPTVAEQGHPQNLGNALLAGGFIGVLDLIGSFTQEIPGVGIVMAIVYFIIQRHWFSTSGMKFTPKRITVLALQSLLESIPGVGNFVWGIVSVIVNYYIKD